MNHPPSTAFTSGYVRRIVDELLDELLPQLPAILLDGPKAVGKTATATRRARTVHDLGDPGPRATARADPRTVLHGTKPILIDEWQRVEATWDTVKAAVDRDFSGGQYLLAGSAAAPSPDGHHSGAGRITPVRMRPLTLAERSVCTPTVSLADLLTGARAPITGRCDLRLVEYTEQIVGSGFPALQHLTPRARSIALDGYLARIVDSDLEEAGLRVRRPATVAAWLRAYAAATSTTASWETIRGAATSGAAQVPARSTTLPYVDALTRLRILDEVPAWTPTFNHLSRVGQAPKHHLADPALAARLTGMTVSRLLDGDGPAAIPRDGVFLGALFESLATLCVRVYAQASDAQTAHLRAHDGRREIDVIVIRDDGLVLAVEVKLAAVVDDHDVRHLRWLRDELGDQVLDQVILTTGEQAYRRPDGIAVIPLGLLGP